jgi:hypothetical protein
MSSSSLFVNNPGALWSTGEWTRKALSGNGLPGKVDRDDLTPVCRAKVPGADGRLVSRRLRGNKPMAPSLQVAAKRL